MLIKIPDNYIPEREYILDVLLNEYLGLEYKTEKAEGNSYQIVLDNGNTLVIKDALFINAAGTYLKKEFLPDAVIYAKNQFTIEEDIPVIYGDAELKVSKNEIVTGIDIFSSSFFMLARWEEYVNKKRDKYNRFPASESTAFKNRFLDRPVVNEYVEMLWNMLKYLGYKQKRKSRKFGALVSHDVDHPLFSLRSLLRSTLACLLKRFSFKDACNTVSTILSSRNDLKEDPFNTFHYLMEQSEKRGLKSYFFFMGAKRSKNDSGYSLKSCFISSLVSEIIKRGHGIGFHPGYNTYNKLSKWRREYNQLSKCIDEEVVCGRQHFLRFEAPLTWQIWEDNNMKWDSSLSYADQEGFRCGTCYDFPVFNFISRKRLKLKEKPLIIMEMSVSYAGCVDLSKIKERAFYYIDKIKKYNGEFVFLWHNSSFNHSSWQDSHVVYEEILDRLQG